MNLGSRDVFPAHHGKTGCHPCSWVETAHRTATLPRHLVWLRDQLGDRFLGGVVLHIGPATFSLGDRITAAPISTLWA